VGQILQRHLKAQVYDPWLNLSADLYAGYDVVILAASLNPESRGLLAETFFASCPEHLLLINAARAELIDQTALLQFLSRAPRARAVLDVHLSEPYSTAPYPSHQVIATPHIAGVWAGLIEEMLRFEVQQLQEFTQGRLDQNLLLSNRMTPQGFYR
jgi:phosphoglycerate dehydrogenase-like enzyme